jgi:hypothetical protein
MSRVTAPAAKLSRTLSAGAPTQNAGAVLMPKYAELLRSSRNNEHHDSSRGLSTTHRPTPQPSITNRAKPLMQTFHSSAAAAAPVSHLDTTRLPSLDAASGSAPADFGVRVPLVPDSYSIQHATPYVPEEPIVSAPKVNIVAADPSNVVAANSLSQVSSFALDGLDFKFVHEQQAKAQAQQETGMLKDIWMGIKDDIFGAQQPPKSA